MANEQNLKPFPPGVSGNPAGRKPGAFSLVGMIKEKLQEIPEGEKKTYAAKLIEKMMAKATDEGDVAMMKDLIDRIDGKALQGVDLTTGGQPLAINVINYGADAPPQLPAKELPDSAA